MHSKTTDDPSIQTKDFDEADRIFTSSPPTPRNLPGINTLGSELQFFTMRPVVRDLFDKVELSWSTSQPKIHDNAIRARLESKSKLGPQDASIVEVLQTLNLYEQNVLNRELFDHNLHREHFLLSLERTRTVIRHRDIWFKDVLGLQFVVQKSQKQTQMADSPLNAANEPGTNTMYGHAERKDGEFVIPLKQPVAKESDDQIAPAFQRFETKRRQSSKCEGKNDSTEYSSDAGTSFIAKAELSQVPHQVSTNDMDAKKWLDLKSIRVSISDIDGWMGPRRAPPVPKTERETLWTPLCSVAEASPRDPELAKSDEHPAATSTRLLPQPMYKMIPPVHALQNYAPQIEDVSGEMNRSDRYRRHVEKNTLMPSIGISSERPTPTDESILHSNSGPPAILKFDGRLSENKRFAAPSVNSPRHVIRDHCPSRKAPGPGEIQPIGTRAFKSYGVASGEAYQEQGGGEVRRTELAQTLSRKRTSLHISSYTGVTQSSSATSGLPRNPSKICSTIPRKLNQTALLLPRRTTLTARRRMRKLSSSAYCGNIPPCATVG